MPQPSLGSADTAPPSRDRRGIVVGVIAGVIALSCCVGPTVAAVVGITSATVAIDVATDLYGAWGWAFKLAGVAFAAAAILILVRRRRTCGGEPRVFRSLLVVALAGLVTYSLLYVGTTWLGARASEPSPPPEILVEGSSVEQRVASALSQVREHYPYFRVELERMSAEGVAFSVGWHIPDLPPLDDEYNEEIVRRVEDTREATFVLLRAIARSDPTLDHFSAYEDQLYIPIWSRAQVLTADPIDLRDFHAYTEFIFSARDLAGYAAIFRDHASK